MSTSAPQPPAGAPLRARVVRAERGAVLVVPDADLGAVARRAELPRDGLLPLPDGTRTPPTVGDVVDVVGDDAGETWPADEHATALHATALRATGLHPRRTAVVRDSAGRTSLEQVVAANVDVVLVVEHLDPDPDLGRVERLLTLAWRSGARPVVVLTKADLVPDPDGMAAEVAQVAIGVDVHAVSVLDGAGLEPLRALLAPGVAIVVVGASGAGKSSLVNRLAGREVMATGEVRVDGRGRHTTTHRELVPLADGAVLVDTPGLRGIGLVAAPEALDATFADVTALAAACRFTDCSHEREPGCAVQAAVASGELPARRLASWRKLAREAAYQARRADARLAAEERARWRRITRDHHRALRGRGAPRP
ncbi:ribosome small subunit-dependent GTPase A [Cellulomonas sp. zg-ZUI222]|uniref:Small ribosomal subunit biogenesis GTPase RsgA n=1 Tax=Cellulomonas wangleii TaxID=2816956 RepID=A0ABX8D2Q4_9CELL|nr:MULTISPECIES: ribosome small subunit-dependent GTPase A [Cellulomonas]MBO0899354.1 ribosome small subunit-dependent GTPase A [Cellulomonas sp. zg-ZUI22]MBO0920206.1 ribosome small subunit-dependent GTPase A [Cellulomonas wangleii]MBO0923368.1 ribosome small subunit-dependent GTPase A [Cellulomonas wangleii]QVI61723.1 ribosome small subunit-dependent GTPase A [Cellulomonas wangleii]